MSATSVRQVLQVAAADRSIGLQEAELASFIANRTNGVDADERAEFAAILEADVALEPGVREHFEATAEPAPTAEASASQAVRQIINARGLDVLEMGTDADESKFGPKLMASLERFSELTGNGDAGTLAGNALELRAGAENVVLVRDYDGSNNCEVLGVFDAEGRELGRVGITDEADALAMRWLIPTGQVGKPIATPTQHAFDRLPDDFRKTLEAFIAEREGTGDGFGKDIDISELPDVLRRRYAMMQRTIEDATGLEKAEVAGVTVYVLRDFSCVSSSHFFTENGKRLMTIEG